MPSRFIGKDELNLADWRISVPTYQQPLKLDGGKVDYIKYTVPTKDGTNKTITLQAPSRIGLPTPTDEDVVIALLTIAKEQGFKQDKVRFVPSDVIRTLRWADRQESYQRLNAALKRLVALTVCYEFAWYNKLKAKVEETLTTHILAEAKLILKRGRRSKNEEPSSYIQWTNDFYQSIKGGNLTDLNLDVYFSLERPTTKHLYRHLNKRFHGARRNKPYERDLVHLACGHLGMTNSKDLKRNFDNAVKELEDIGYLPKRDTKDRYRKVRPKVYRVCFDPPAATTAPQQKQESGASDEEKTDSPARVLVREFHAQWSDNKNCTPTDKEIEFADELLSKHPPEQLEKLLKKVIRAMHDGQFDNAKYFSASRRYFETEIARDEKEAHQRECEKAKRTKEAIESAKYEAEAAKERDRFKQLRSKFSELSEDERQRIQKQAITNANSEFIGKRIRDNGIGENVTTQVLEEFARL